MTLKVEKKRVFKSMLKFVWSHESSGENMSIYWSSNDHEVNKSTEICFTTSWLCFYIFCHLNLKKTKIKSLHVGGRMFV
jgi:GH25 family lysozyme M1 (1,4-beta-N-acetylmuramidase)